MFEKAFRHDDKTTELIEQMRSNILIRSVKLSRQTLLWAFNIRWMFPNSAANTFNSKSYSEMHPKSPVIQHYVCLKKIERPDSVDIAPAWRTANSDPKVHNICAQPNIDVSMLVKLSHLQRPLTFSSHARTPTIISLCISINWVDTLGLHRKDSSTFYN